MDPTSITESLHPLEIKVLKALETGGVMNESHLSESCDLEPSQVSMALGWLLTKSLAQVESEDTTPIAMLTEVGEHYLHSGTPFEVILQALEEARRRDTTITMQDLQQRQDLEPTEISRAVGLLKKEGSIQIGSGGFLELTGVPSRIRDALRMLLQLLDGHTRELSEIPEESQRRLLDQYAVKRGSTREPFRIEHRVTRWYTLTQAGKQLEKDIRSVLAEDEVSQVTPELLKDGSWRTKRFRKYTINLRPPRIAAGKRHPYREFLDLVKRKLTNMGFQEMKGPLVETEFWNMDALYMPQFHPAREIHDAYFVKDPTHAAAIPEPFLTQVSDAHEHGGGTGSTGWSYAYDRTRARRLILRSQGTAVSARTLASQPQVPGKYFAIARCFRYDQVDATHATDFFQVEGIVLGDDINFRTLLGLLDLFAKEMAHAKESRFLPAYFPFTEPSVELHARHPRLGWIELGGAGLLRPEVTRPLGVEVPVIAWGLGLDRMAMVALGIHDIRDLFSTDLEKIRAMRGRF